jgi:hypothetical protein
MLSLSNGLCKGPMRDLIVIVVITMFMLHSLHYFVVFKTSQIDVNDQNRLASLSNRIEQTLKPEISLLRGAVAVPSAAKISISLNTSLPAVTIISPSVVLTTPKPTPPAHHITMISLNKPVTSDVRGNLGPPEMVTNERIEDWLKDRWQGNTNCPISRQTTHYTHLNI